MEGIPINEFGYSEMYEWKGGKPEFPEVYKEGFNNNVKFGKFVQFATNAVEEQLDDHAKVKYDKIELFHNNVDGYAGVTTPNTAFNSNNPSEWHDKFISNEFGDKYVRKERLAVGNCVYEQNNEIQIMQTRPWEHYAPINHPNFDKEKKYVKRTDRDEWIMVNIMGKCVVEDNGECIPGKCCTPYVGPFKDMWGKAIPADSNSKLRFFVLERISPRTIMIMNRPIIM